MGVFSDSTQGSYVVNSESNLCGEFKRGNANNPNWLPDGWQAIEYNSGLSELYSQTTECESGSYESCCRSMGYRYAGVPIGISSITQERKAAEFLSSKGIIENQSFQPDSYNLNASINRKEVMKVIINSSGVLIDNNCSSSFDDVINDWGCKYIEAALQQEYIAKNQIFRPNDEITKTEALKLIFKARNINKSYNTNSWQDDYISTALYLGFLDEKYSNYNEIATRGWIFTVLAKSYIDFKSY